MKIPGIVKIGGHVFAIEMKEGFMSDDNCAEMDQTTNTIRIRSDMPESQIAVSLIHEALHAMNSSVAHEFLDSLAEQIYQFLEDNKFLAK